MSDRVLALLVAVLLPAMAHAQDTQADLARLRAMRYRVQVIDSERTHGRNLERARSAAQRIGSLYRSGAVRLISHGPDSVIGGATRLADSIFANFGAIPEDFIAGSVFVQVDVASRDSLLEAAGPADRVLEVDLARMSAASDAVWQVLLAAATGYRPHLDAAWREWLPPDFGMLWNTAREGTSAMRGLTEDQWSSGQSCLAGSARDCRRWLALDSVTDPYTGRYDARDLRRIIRRVYVLRNDQDYAACIAGSDAACSRMPARHGRFIVETIPAGEVMRASVVRSLYDAHGAEGVHRALHDSAGSIGDRLSRASGTSIDSVVTSWRLFVLRRGHADRVEASLPDAFAALLAAGLFAALAARSGRWR